MSIAKFTASLRNNADKVFTREAQDLLNRFVANANEAFASGGIRKAASIISQGKATLGGREVQLSTAFREKGEKQGRTRLILTEDDLQDIFREFNISSEVPPMVSYAKFLAKNYKTKLARHFEVYLRDGTIVEKGKEPISTVLDNLAAEDIIAIRGLNFSHDNTIRHVAHFLYDINAFSGKSRVDIEKILTGSYDRGHVYAQTYGRAIVSLGDLVDEENIISDITKLYQLMDEGSTSLNRLDGKYNMLLARSRKDFTSKKLAMNIQLQLKRNIAGTGNRDTGELSSYVQIVRFLQKLIKNSRLSADGKRQLGMPAAESLKEFEKALTDLDSKLTKYSKEISKVIANTRDPDYLVKLQTSDSIEDFLGKSIKNTIKNNTSSSLKVDTGNASILQSDKVKTKVRTPSKLISSNLNSIKSDLQKAKQAIINRKRSKVVDTLNKRSTTTSLSSLLTMVNRNLHDQIKKNMGTGTRTDVLNYRSGRFAKSAKVERLSESRQGMITAFYSYMKNPYATFSAGGRQEFPRTRDPKLLISKSIRELAAEQVQNRLRAVLV